MVCQKVHKQASIKVMANIQSLIIPTSFHKEQKLMVPLKSLGAPGKYLLFSLPPPTLTLTLTPPPPPLLSGPGCQKVFGQIEREARMCAMVNGKELKECMSLLESIVHEQYKRASDLVPIHLRNKVREHHGTNTVFLLKIRHKINNFKFSRRNSWRLKCKFATGKPSAE